MFVKRKFIDGVPPLGSLEHFPVLPKRSVDTFEQARPARQETRTNLRKAKHGSKLYDAIRANDIDRVTTLLQRGASVRFVDAAGNTPLMCAVQMRSLRMVQLLLEHNAICTYQHKNNQGKNVSNLEKSIDISNAISRSLGHFIETVVVPDLQRCIAAAQSGEEIQKMAQSQFEYFQDCVNTTVLNYLVTQPAHSLPCLEYLKSCVQNNAWFFYSVHSKISFNFEWLTFIADKQAFWQACSRKNLEWLKYLCEQYPDNVNTRDTSGLTPVLHAAKCGFEQGVRFLMQVGADLSLSDISGKGILDYLDSCSVLYADVQKHLQHQFKIRELPLLIERLHEATQEEISQLMNHALLTFHEKLEILKNYVADHKELSSHFVAAIVLYAQKNAWALSSFSRLFELHHVVLEKIAYPNSLVFAIRHNLMSFFQRCVERMIESGLSLNEVRGPSLFVECAQCQRLDMLQYCIGKGFDVQDYYDATTHQFYHLDLKDSQSIQSFYSDYIREHYVINMPSYLEENNVVEVSRFLRHIFLDDALKLTFILDVAQRGVAVSEEILIEMKRFVSSSLERIRYFVEHCQNYPFMLRVVGEYPFHVAISVLNDSFLDFLMQHHYLEIDTPNQEELSPFFYAFRMGRTALAEKLLRNGANITPISDAEKKIQTEHRKFFQQAQDFIFSTRSDFTGKLKNAILSGSTDDIVWLLNRDHIYNFVKMIWIKNGLIKSKDVRSEMLEACSIQLKTKKISWQDLRDLCPENPERALRVLDACVYQISMHEPQTMSCSACAEEKLCYTLCAQSETNRSLCVDCFAEFSEPETFMSKGQCMSACCRLSPDMMQHAGIPHEQIELVWRNYRLQYLKTMYPPESPYAVCPTQDCWTMCDKKKSTQENEFILDCKHCKQVYRVPVLQIPGVYHHLEYVHDLVRDIGPISIHAGNKNGAGHSRLCPRCGEPNVKDEQCMHIANMPCCGARDVHFVHGFGAQGHEMYLEGQILPAQTYVPSRSVLQELGFFTRPNGERLLPGPFQAEAVLECWNNREQFLRKFEQKLDALKQPSVCITDLYRANPSDYVVQA